MPGLAPPVRGEAGFGRDRLNPAQIAAFCPYVRSPADIMMVRVPNTDREDVHSW
jgi:hypothetical protein